MTKENSFLGQEKNSQPTITISNPTEGKSHLLYQAADDFMRKFFMKIQDNSMSNLSDNKTLVKHSRIFDLSGIPEGSLDPYAELEKRMDYRLDISPFFFGDNYGTVGKTSYCAPLSYKNEQERNEVREVLARNSPGPRTTFSRRERLVEHTMSACSLPYDLLTHDFGVEPLKDM